MKWLEDTTNVIKMSDERDWKTYALVGVCVFLACWILTDGFTNVPILNVPIIGPGQQPGVQTKTTVVFYNGTSAADGTIQLITFAGVPVASGSISAGTGTTGTVTPGIYIRYISGVTGGAAYVDTVNVTAVTDVAQTYVTLDPVQLYRNSTTYAMTLQAEGAAYTRTNADAALTNKNFTLSAQVAADFVMTLTEKQGYARLFEAYQDPISKVSCEPVVWIEVTSTNVYSTSAAIKSFEDSTKTYFLMPLSSVLNPGKESKSGTASFSLTAPTAGDIAYTCYIVTYSDMTTLINAETRVANAAGPFTVSTWQLCAGYFNVS